MFRTTYRSIRRAGLKPLLAALALLAAGLIQPARPASAQTSPSQAATASLRILTYNTAFLSVPLPSTCPISEYQNNDGMAGMNYTQRAGAIADRILATDSDVVVLNEVFSDEARGVLVSKLAATFPNYIAKIKARTKVSEDLSPFIPLVESLLAAANPAQIPVLALCTHLVDTADSGLMVFSRYPFTPFSPGTTPPYEKIQESTGRNAGSTWGASGQLAFRPYETCVEMDCLASKGVGMVRVINPRTQRISNIAFSHTQAWEGTKQRDVRSQQFKDIRSLITQSLTSSQLASESVYLAGDLNVQGLNQATGTTGAEWSMLFHPAAGSFFGCGEGPCTFAGGSTGTFLTDSWGFETSPTDLGITNDEDGARLDYILHSRPSASLCMQHIRIPMELGDPGAVSHHSDHLGVQADFNSLAPRCSPNDDAGRFGPKPLAFGALRDIEFNGISPVTVDDRDTRLAVPGNVQWYRIDEAGSYTIDVLANQPAALSAVLPPVPSNDVTYKVYHHSDLSRPVWDYDKDGGWYGTCEEQKKKQHTAQLPEECGSRYALPAPPYYVKVFAPNRDWAGKYHIRFHRHQGLSRNDHILLSPNVAMPFTWPGSGFTPAENSDTRFWFRFSTGLASSGKRPSLTIRQEFGAALSDYSLYDMIVVPDKDPGSSGGHPVFDVLATYGTEMIEDADTHRKAQNFRLPALPLSSTAPQTNFFVLLSRDSWEFGIERRSTITFGSNLTYFRPLKLWAADAWDEVLATDQIKMSFNYDIEDRNLHSPGYSHDFQNGEWDNLADNVELSGSYLKEVSLPIWEDGDEYMFPEPGSYAPGSPSPELMLVSNPANRWGGPGQPPRPETVIYNDRGNIDDANYWYEFTYIQSYTPFPKCSVENVVGCIP
jgi:hypothetical protein